jgi:N-acetylneuraminic acid mutarotase
MKKGRGCFSACYHDEFIYVFGGLNLEENVLNQCEKYDIEKDIWYEIADMHIARKNSSVCTLTADTLYVFGGTCNNGRMTDSIELYLISANLWIQLKLKLPNPASFITTFKVSPF